MAKGNEENLRTNDKEMSRSIGTAFKPAVMEEGAVLILSMQALRIACKGVNTNATISITGNGDGTVKLEILNDAGQAVAFPAEQ